MNYFPSFSGIFFFFYFYLCFLSSTVLLPDQATFPWLHETPAGHNTGVPLLILEYCFPPSAFPYIVFHCVGADGIRYRGLRTNPLAKILKYRTALSKQRKSGLLILNWTKATQCTANQKENWMFFFSLFA